MLVLSRRRDEKIRIGPDIVIQVVDIRSGQVRIGVEAPESLEITRWEITPDSDVRSKIDRILTTHGLRLMSPDSLSRLREKLDSYSPSGRRLLLDDLECDVAKGEALWVNRGDSGEPLNAAIVPGELTSTLVTSPMDTAKRSTAP